ncbi:diaminopimelate epimerase [Buchnera aphidicola]|uniref:diaminopimelate epimerase n=1 Tax=Buchnera aphidicola TaxID=9 RepID=UPI0031B82DD6
MKLINFSKMHGLGNDFAIFNNLHNKLNFNSVIVKNLSNRNTGIGFDQLILVEKSFNKKIDFIYRIFNFDGTEVSQCINGARCFGRFINIKKISKKNNICIVTKNQKIYLKDINKKYISVNISNPSFDPNDIPFLDKYSKNGYIISKNLKKIKFFLISLGNPHCVIFVDNIFLENINLIGSFLEKHVLFPMGVNVNFVEIVSRKKIIVRTYERGVGETQACGSGACASVAIGVKNGVLDSNVKVNLLGGKLYISCKKNFKDIFVCGSAIHVYDGFIDLEKFC